MLRDRLVAYFAANPDESLTIADVNAKFDATYDTIRSVVDHMRDVGLLESTRGETGLGAPLVLTIGPELAAMVGRGPNVRANTDQHGA